MQLMSAVARGKRVVKMPTRDAYHVPRKVSVIPAAPSLNIRSKFMKIVDRWPLALIVFGGVLTLVWVAVLIWAPLRLLQIV